MDFKSEIQFWFTIVGSGVAFVLGAIKIWEWWTSRKGKWLNLLVPKLRDIRALMKTDHFIEASDLYHKEIHAKGFEPVLDRISGHVDREHHLPSLFFRLWILLGYRRHDSEREEPMTVTKDLADTCSRIVVQIDRILDKSKSA
jgi:hypothetical protein